MQVFFGEREERSYSTDLSAKFLAATRSEFELRQISAETMRFREKGVFILDELYLTKGLVWRMRPAGKSNVPVCHTEVFASFLKIMERSGRLHNSVLLGHRSIKPTKQCISLDVSRLRQCALDFGNVGGVHGE